MWTETYNGVCLCSLCVGGGSILERYSVYILSLVAFDVEVVVVVVVVV